MGGLRMSVLILKNYPSEGPGTIEDFLLKNQITYKIVEFYKEDCLDYKNCDALILMGGPMSVNDTDECGYLNKEEEITRYFIESGKKVLGICLGSQMIAKTLGSKVYKGNKPEIGWYNIPITEDGKNDETFANLLLPDDKHIKVFHWHGETFDLPEGSVRLAYSDLYPNQAFSYGKNVYSLQFHIEVKKEMVYEWMKNEDVNIEEIRTQTEDRFDEYIKRAEGFYSKFFRIQK
ncbi:glutamine amidotransferase class-I [Candidatus Magnetoovum chiemensis]|nr:glutamine amidotransferase class-I [Candidatus Magnetoovum chiemensis]